MLASLLIRLLIRDSYEIGARVRVARIGVSRRRQADDMPIIRRIPAGFVMPHVPVLNSFRMGRRLCSSGLLPLSMDDPFSSEHLKMLFVQPPHISPMLALPHRTARTKLLHTTDSTRTRPMHHTMPLVVLM